MLDDSDWGTWCRKCLNIHDVIILLTFAVPRVPNDSVWHVLPPRKPPSKSSFLRNSDLVAGDLCLGNVWRYLLFAEHLQVWIAQKARTRVIGYVYNLNHHGSSLQPILPRIGPTSSSLPPWTSFIYLKYPSFCIWRNARHGVRELWPIQTKNSTRRILQHSLRHHWIQVSWKRWLAHYLMHWLTRAWVHLVL